MLSLLNADARVVQAVLNGDRNRFEVLVRKYLGEVYAIAYAYTRNRADAEDITQDAFLNAFENLEQLRDPQRFRPWLFTIVRNRAHAAWRRQAREDQLTPLGTSENDLRSTVEAEERKALLQKHLNALDPEQREVLQLHYFGGRSTREIAIQLNMNREAVKKRLERARAALGASLMDDLDTSTPQISPRKVKEIMGLVLATSTVRQASASGIAAGTTGGLLFKAASIVVAALIAVPLLLLMQRVQTKAEETRESPPPVEIPLSAPVPNESVENVDAADPTERPAPREEEPVPLASCVDMERMAAFVAIPNEPQAVLPKYTLESPVALEFEAIALREILEFLEKQFEIPLLLDETMEEVPHEVVTSGMMDRFQVEDRTVQDALESLCEIHGLAMVLEPGYLWISTPELIQQEVQPAPASWYEEYDLETRLKQQISLDFQDIHISEALNFVGMSENLNLVLDSRVVAPRPKQDQATAPGAFPGAFPGGPRPGSKSLPVVQAIEKEAPETESFMIEYLSLPKLKLRDALRAVLRMHNLGYKMEPYGVVISTAEELESLVPKLAKLEAPDPAVNAALSKFVTLEINGKRVLDAFVELQALTGLCFQIAEREQDKLRITVGRFPKEPVPLEAALTLLALKSDLPMLFSGGTIYLGARNRHNLNAKFVSLESPVEAP